MAVLKKDQSQSTHWYKADGSPCHRLPRAGGDGLRPTTLRDAKRLRLSEKGRPGFWLLIHSDDFTKL